MEPPPTKDKNIRERDERRLLAPLKGALAKQVQAEYDFLPELVRDEWAKIVWYSDKCGGKLIVFKAGNPYLPKEGKRKGNDTLPEEEHEKQRLANSLSRTKRCIYELAACNPWQWFFTGTLDGEKADRRNLNETFKRLSQWIRDYRKGQTGEKIKYLIIPEQHKDGAWHFHGLFYGLTENELHKFDVSENIPARLKNTIAGGTPVWTWSAYAKRFGYSTITSVRDEAAVAAYVTKYITKEMVVEKRGDDTGRHLYYASQGLKKAETAAESHLGVDYLPPCDYENDYLRITNIRTKDEARALIARYGIKEENAW